MTIGIWDLNEFQKTHNRSYNCFCSSSKCSSPTKVIATGEEVYEAADLNVMFHEKCFQETQAYKNSWQMLVDDIPKPVQKTANFWARHRTKILLGASATLALIGLGVGALYKTNDREEQWHRFCLHSAEYATDLYCCAKEIAASAADCVFKKFEPANFWAPSSNTEEFAFADLPATHEDPIILSNWTVSAWQKLFRKLAI